MQNDNITNTTAYVDEKEKAEYNDGEEVEQADVTNDEDQDESITLEVEGDTELNQPQGQANNEEDICLRYAEPLHVGCLKRQFTCSYCTSYYGGYSYVTHT